MTQPTRVSIISRSFPHYRAPVARQLQTFKGYAFTWVGDRVDTVSPDVPSMEISELGNFVLAPCRPLPFGLFWQHGLISHALRSRDDVHIYTGDARGLATWISALLSRLRGKRVMYWGHGWRRYDQGLRKLTKAAFFRTAHALLLYGEHARGIGIRNGFAPSRLHVISNSMGAPILPTRRAGARTSAQRWIVVSRLIEGRQLDEVVRQVHRLAAQGRHVELTVVGDGPARRMLEQLAVELRIGAKFLGAVYDLTRTGELLRDADICISPGHIGLAAIHALSSGCPVATHSDMHRQMPEAEAIRDGETGVLFRWGRFNEMADRAWDFVSSTSAKDVAKKCHDEVDRRWTPERHATQMIRAIDSELSDCA